MDISIFEGFLKAVFYLFLTTGGGKIVYEAIEHVPFLVNLTPVMKRVSAGVLSVIVGLVGYFGLIIFQWIDMPVGDWRAWAVPILNIACYLFATSQGWHLQQLPSK